MKRILIITILALVGVASATAQNSILRPRMEVAELETDSYTLDVFYMNDESPRVYYLSVGNLGMGNKVIQINIDPIVELFIPLGGSLDEAVATMEQLKAFYKQPRKTTMELTGIFAAAYPNDNYVPVTVTSRRILLSKRLEFSIQSENMIRSTYISKSDFSGVLISLKLYKKLHPDE